ncbi:hypothetical protein GGF46_001473 [Coemansia sp. RSA 552]|nr:hypothetical protein GGF46_001473 [Coemansia sp. RSA 552]
MKVIAILAAAAMSVAAASEPALQATPGQDFCCMANAVLVQRGIKELRWHKQLDIAADANIQWMRASNITDKDDVIVSRSLEPAGMKDIQLTIYPWYGDTVETMAQRMGMSDNYNSVPQDVAICGGGVEAVPGDQLGYFAAMYGTLPKDKMGETHALKCDGHKSLGIKPEPASP